MATLEQRRYDGEQARQVLENEAFARAFEDIEKEYTEAWKQSPARDAEGREKLYLTIKLLHRLRGTLQASLQDGQLAALEIERQKTMLQRAKEFVGIES